MKAMDEPEREPIEDLVHDGDERDVGWDGDDEWDR